MIEKEITTMNLNNAKYYGQNPQMNQFTEELAELIQAVAEGDPQHIAEDVFELELRRDYIGVKTKISAEYLQKYILPSCLEGVLMGEYDRMAYMLGAVTGCNNAPEDLR